MTNNSKIDEFLNKSQKKKQSKFQEFFQSNEIKHLRLHLIKKYAFWKQPRFHGFMKNQFPMVSFTCVSTYIVYLMYKKHYEIVAQVNQNKTVQQDTADKEQKLLRKILEDPTNKYYNRQIEEIKRNKKYQFEKYENIGKLNDQLNFKILIQQFY